MDIFYEIEKLVRFGIKYNYISEEDRILVTNEILEVLEIYDFRMFADDEIKQMEKELEKTEYPVKILDNIIEWCIHNDRLENPGIAHQDLLNSKIMGRIIPRSSEIIKIFYELFSKDHEKATDYFYELSKQSNYIRTDRIKKDMHWGYKSEYGELEITINFSKPEKDPKEIALAKSIPSSSYPKCLLCKENEGYSGTVKHPGRQNHRIIPIELKDEKWFLQYSPYIYYNEHCIILSEEHRPMKIDKSCFARLLDFVEKFPHYFVGSNADLPIVGGSILSHDHFQGGKHVFPMERAEISDEIIFDKFPAVKAGIVKWPLSVIRINGNKNDILELADIILKKWIDYSDLKNDILNYTGNERHNTITPIARFRDGKFELDLVLRNNRTTKEHPLGLFHPHEEYHNIKKENIGLIEVMGLAVLPGRLKEEMNILKEYIFSENPLDLIEKDDSVSKHLDWCKKFIFINEKITVENIENIINSAIGETFACVLKDCGVFKDSPDGKNGFYDFIRYIDKESEKAI